ncbi:MAG: hypothetical protein P8Z30_09490 [Acidobacteriota bacterium]
MKGTISLAQELRAIRTGGGNGTSSSKRRPEPKLVERPWQADIDRIQQTLQDVLQTFSNLSGVELPGVTADSKDSGGPLPKLDVGTLKDRIRNDLEAFSVTTAAELSKQAEEKTRTALGTIENEMQGRIDQVAGEFRDKLQSRLGPENIEIDVTEKTKDRVAELVQAQTDEFARWVWLMCKGTDTPIPAQIEKLLEPYVEEATAKLAGVFQQKVQDLLAEQEQTAQGRFQETIGALESQVGTLEQTAREICEHSADAVAKESAEKLNAAAEEAAKNFAGRMQGEAEGVFGSFQTRLQETAAASQEGLRREESQREENFRQRLEGLASEVQQKSMSEIPGRITQTVANAVESSVQHLHQQAEDSLERSREEIKAFLEMEMEGARQQIHDLGWSTHQALSQDAGRVGDTLQGLDQELAGLRDQHIEASREQLASVIQGSMESLTERITQITEHQVQEIDQLVRDSQQKAASQYESRLQEVNESRYNDLMGRIQHEAGEAGARVAAEMKSTSESVMQELSERVNASASVLREEAAQATSHIESSVQKSLEAFRQQLGQITETRFEEHRKSIAGSMADFHQRLKQAAELLVPGDLER